MYAGRVKRHNVCKRRVAIDIGVKQDPPGPLYSSHYTTEFGD